MAGDENFHGAQSVEREAVSLAQAFAANHRLNAGGLQKRPDLVGVKLTVRHEYALRRLIHRVTPAADDCTGSHPMQRCSIQRHPRAQASAEVRGDAPHHRDGGCFTMGRGSA